MSTYSYQKVLREAQSLSPDEQYRLVLQGAQSLPLDEQYRLVQEVIAGLQRKQSQVADQQARMVKETASSEIQQQKEEEEPLHNIMEWKGIGKELWRTVDVDKYIAEERASWNG